jgi:pimeloyl-ACP methyl ester carboxylesterase
MKLVVQDREVYAYTGGKPFDPALPCIVFLHGAVNDHSVWTLLARWFAHHGHAVLAVDLPGHLRSEGPVLTSVEALADWTIALLDAAGVERAALVGHSMGSLIALEAAARAPGRVSQLAMIGTSVPMPVPQALLDLALADVQAAIDRVVMFSFSTLAAKPSFPGPGTWLRGCSRGMMRQVVAHGEKNLFHTEFSVCNRYAGGLDAAARVSAPSLLILGQFDQMTLPRGAAEVATQLGATVHTLPTGHYPMQECPDPVLNALRPFLR